MHLGVLERCKGWLLLGIGEMQQNIDEMAKKTDAICTWVCWSNARDTCVMASVKCSKTSMKWPKRPMQYAVGCSKRCKGYMCNGIGEMQQNIDEMA
jgi:hypothetical protein